MIMILAINGSYRDDGVTDQTVDVLKQALEGYGEHVEVVLLREYPIEFCLNCRECTQKPGLEPGECVHHDAMQELINRIEKADAYILASPTNFGSVTAVFKRFMERLVPYAYWPWEMHAPQFRKNNVKKKKALLVSSSAAPGLLARLVFGTHGQLKMTAKVIGAKPAGTIFTGLVATSPQPTLSHRTLKKIRAKASALVN
jgi:multimeric flavodoxin WrbA